MVGKLLESSAGSDHGYNAANNTYEDLVKNGIIDPLKVSNCVFTEMSPAKADMLLASVYNWPMLWRDIQHMAHSALT